VSPTPELVAIAALIVVGLLLVTLVAFIVTARQMVSELKAKLRESEELRKGWEVEAGRVGALEAELKSLHEETVPTIERLTGALNEAHDERDRALTLAAKDKKRADDQFAVIEDFDREKRQIWEIYRDSCLGAGNCQDLLFTELTRIIRLHNTMAKKHGFKPDGIRQAIRDAVEAFASKHRDEPAIKERLDAKMGRSGSGEARASD
jgi:hypothetical protein